MPVPVVVTLLPVLRQWTFYALHNTLPVLRQWTSAAFFAHGHQDPCFGHASWDGDHDDDAQDDEDCDDDNTSILSNNTVMGILPHCQR